MPSGVAVGGHARRAAYPVEVKPFGHDLPTEPAGCPVERNVARDAMVRAAFATILAATGRATTDATGVIIRETPPQGRELSGALIKLPQLGWTVVLDGSGGPVAAARPTPADRRPGARRPGRGVSCWRPRARSHRPDRIARLDLPRVIVGGRGARTLVAAAAELR